jgi:hypothetical protein
MRTFEFTSPEGKIYEVQGPADATQEQAWGILQQRLGSQSGGSAPTQNAVEEEDLIQTLAEEQGPLDAALIGAGRAAVELGRGIKELFGGEVERDPTEEAAYAALQNERPIATAVGETAPYLVAGGLAGAAARGASTGVQIASQVGAGGAVGALQPGTGEERLKRGATDAALSLVGEGVGRGIGKLAAPRKAPIPTGQGDLDIAQAAQKSGYKVLPTGRSADVAEKPIEEALFTGPAVKRINRFNQNKLDKDAVVALGGKGARVTEDLLTKKSLLIHKNLTSRLPDNIPLNVFQTPVMQETVPKSVAFLRESKNPAAKQALELLDDLSRIVTKDKAYAKVPGVNKDLVVQSLREMRELSAKIASSAPLEANTLILTSDAILRTLGDSYKSISKSLDNVRIQNNILTLLRMPGSIKSNGHVDAAKLAGTINNLSPSILENTESSFLHGVRLLGTTQLADQTIGKGIGSLFLGSVGGGGIGAAGAALGGMPIAQFAAAGAIVGPAVSRALAWGMPKKSFAKYMSRSPKVAESATIQHLGNMFVRTMFEGVTEDTFRAMTPADVQAQMNNASPEQREELRKEMNRYIRGRKLNPAEKALVRDLREELRQ